MNWKKLGRIFVPDTALKPGLTGASMPVAEILDESNGLVRVYFSPRDPLNRSQVSFLEFHAENPGDILSTSKEPVLEYGSLGSFDEFGTMLGSVVTVESRKLVFYTGWSLTQGVPYNNSIGIAEFKGDRRAHRLGAGPVMTRTLHEPYSCASPFVIYEDGLYKMWYASMDKWELDGGKPKHFYNIKFASSSDGLHWDRNGHIAIDYRSADEYAFGRPFVKVEAGTYKMWYAVRGSRYTIGYAESSDGLDWERKDHLAGIFPSDSGWDSDMIEYPFIFDLNGNRYMLYNGNGYGATGIGLAVLD